MSDGAVKVDSLLVRIDQSKLYPPFLTAIKGLLADAANEGLYFWGISGYRSYAEQTVLYNQGRTTPGERVTNAAAGSSPHQFGIALDVCLNGSVDRSRLVPDWNPVDYGPLEALADKHGLVWGGTWKFRDNPHLQLPNYITSVHLEPLRMAYELGGLPAVFEYLSKGGSNGVNS